MALPPADSLPSHSFGPLAARLTEPTIVKRGRQALRWPISASQSVALCPQRPTGPAAVFCACAGPAYPTHAPAS